MQNSFGKIEHSNLKCSPIFHKGKSDESKKQSEESLMQNFPYNSMVRNKGVKINSKYEGVSLSDMMTPFYKREGGQESDFSLNQSKEGKFESQGRSGEGVEARGERQDIFSKPTKPNQNSAFLLNYREGGAIKGLDSKRSFSSLSSFSNPPNQNSYNNVYSSILGRSAESVQKPCQLSNPISKPASTIFGRNDKQQTSARDRRLNLTIINNNNYNVSNLSNFSNLQKQPTNNFSNVSNSHIKVREVIKQSDFERRYNRRNVDQNFNYNYGSDSNESSESHESEEEQEQEQDEEKEDPEVEISQSQSDNSDSDYENSDDNYRKEDQPTKNYSSGFSNNKIKTISEVTEILKRKNSGGKSAGMSLTSSYGAPRKTSMNEGKEKRVKSIKNIVDSSISKQLKEEKTRKSKELENEDSNRNYKLKNIETNKFTKKIVEDSWSKSLNDLNYKKPDEYAVYKKNSTDQKLFKNRKLSRSKKTDSTKAEITMIDKEPIAFEHLEYLLKDIPETEEMNSYCNFINPELKNEYLQYMTKGKSNEYRLSFGRNPLIIYQELTDWLLKEMKKLEDGTVASEEISSTTDFCQKILDEMNDISRFTSTLPVIRNPDENILKKKKKRNKNDPANQEDLEGKKFKCDVCEREGRVQFFETGQGLGGHMSRVHKGKSEKFNRKKEIRNRREDFRNILYKAKKIIIGERYDNLVLTKSGKLEAKKIIKENRDGYRKLVRELRKTSFGGYKSSEMSDIDE